MPPGPLRVTVLLNGSAGALARDPTVPDRLAQALAVEPVVAEVRQVPADRLVATARALVGRTDLVVVGGGDGSVSAVAGALADTGVRLGVLPLGTLNHFARELAMPLDVGAALRAIVHGEARPVDVAELDGRVFVNNSSLGIYPAMVRRREQIRRRRGLPKWLAMAVGAVAALRQFPRFRVRVTVDGSRFVTTSPIVFVGCNRYTMSLFALGERERLDGGELCLYVARCTTRLGLVWLALRALVGRIDQARDFTTLPAREVIVETRRARPLVAADGEVVRAGSPLRYRIRPGALWVMAPPATAATQPAAQVAS